MLTEMEAPPADLPAAHSMDTEWFAIDGHGHVGVFESRETGEVPEAHFAVWESNSTWNELLDEIVRLAPPGEIRFVADGVFDGRREHYDDGTLVTESVELFELFDWDSETSVLLELDAARDRVLLDRRLESAYVLGCEQPLVYVSRCPTWDVAEAWHELGIVRALLRPPMEPSRFGVFRYVNREWSGDSYTRTDTPMGAALRVESLATAVRRRLAEVQLSGVDFSRAAEVCPGVYLPTTRWD
jgi:hypothetical protein